MERMDNMVSHIKMQQFSFVAICINAALDDLEIISHPGIIKCCFL